MESAASDAAPSRSPSPPQDGGKSATQRPERSSIVPPYWQAHTRSVSRLSCNSENGARPAPILLEDHTDAGSEQCKALWARHVTIDDYVIISGSAPALGAYVVWNCTVETLDVSLIRLQHECGLVYMMVH
jgi:hypothetical protein